MTVIVSERPTLIITVPSQGTHTGLAKVAVQCSADTFVVNQTLVLRINFCGENRHLRQALPVIGECQLSDKGIPDPQDKGKAAMGNQQEKSAIMAIRIDAVN